MQVCRIEGATRELGKPADWDESKGHCASLPIKDAVTEDGERWMISAWQPEPAELAALNRGESIKLMIRGIHHPVVAMFVGDI